MEIQSGRGGACRRLASRVWRRRRSYCSPAYGPSLRPHRRGGFL